MRKIKDIRTLSIGLEDGGKTRGVCPFCAGGQHCENCFVVRREGTTLWYKCYRASCGKRGRYIVGGSEQLVPNQSERSSHYNARSIGGTHMLPVTYKNFFKERFGIRPVLLEHYGLRKTLDGRIVMPILDPRGKDRGETLRYYEELSEALGPPPPKSKIFIHNNDLPLAWYKLELAKKLGKNVYEELEWFQDDLLVIVEDQVSAIKMSEYCDAVALLGVNLSRDKLVEIASQGYAKVILLLDADAYPKALSLSRTARGIVPELEVRRLQDDPKDTPAWRLQEMLAKSN